MERKPNVRLAELIAEAGVSHLGLASRITEVADEWNERVRPAHTQVARWIAGQQPRGATPALIAEALSRKLRRRVTLADIGMAGTTFSPEVGLAFSEDVGDLVFGLADLWTADVRRRAFLAGKVTAEAVSHPVFQWLLAAPAPQPTRSGRRRVGLGDVEAIKATTAMFANLDNRFGGAHARTAAARYLVDQAAPLLNGTYSGEIGVALFSAVAEFTMTVGWMAYDAGEHGLARRYLLQALNLSHHAGNRLLGASILSAMSHQANYLGEHREALTLARAASQAVQGHDAPLLQAQFSAMQARAAAKIPTERSACLAALAEAERAFERHRSGEEPHWISYFDACELADEFAHCFRDLELPTEAHRYIRQCLDAESDDYARSRTFSRIVLATSLLAQGELDEACRIAATALPRIRQTSSVRCVTYLRDLHDRMLPYGDHSAVRGLFEQARDLLEPRTAS
ncbi:hypothetical protein GCM10022221_10170 [Actinocorallia aurea]